MKRMKKMLSLVLAMVMVLAMATTTFASEGTGAEQGKSNNTKGTIVIDNAEVGQKYTIYKIFELESYNRTTEAYAYKVTSDWKAFVTTGAGKDYVTVDAQGYVTWKTNADVAAFAKAAREAVSGKTKAGEVTAESTTVKFRELPLGYYLLDSSLGTLCSLNTTDSNIVIKEKNETIVVLKEVQENSNESWGSKNDASIGEEVNFRATITAKEGAENYVLHDKMSDGLTFNGEVAVTLGGEPVDAKNYTLKTEGTCGACAFEVVFAKEFCDALKDDQKIVVTYSATVNENAVVNGPNPNEVKVVYGENKNIETIPSKTNTYTWDVEVLKFTFDKANKEQKNPLAGAEFKLSTDEAGEKVIKFTTTATNVYEVDPDGEVTSIVTDETGKFEIEGLDAGTYYLTEITAPDGYNKLAKPVVVTITAGTYNEEDDTVVYTTPLVKVENKTGTLLPGTGGMGTTVIYIAGGVLVLAALILMFARKRKEA